VLGCWGLANGSALPPAATESSRPAGGGGSPPPCACIGPRQRPGEAAALRWMWTIVLLHAIVAALWGCGAAGPLLGLSWGSTRTSRLFETPRTAVQRSAPPAIKRKIVIGCTDELNHNPTTQHPQGRCPRPLPRRPWPPARRPWRWWWWAPAERPPSRRLGGSRTPTNLAHR